MVGLAGYVRLSFSLISQLEILLSYILFSMVEGFSDEIFGYAGDFMRWQW